jgi:hypothetical protein
MGLSREGKQLPVSELSREQEYIGRLYERVDMLRGQASARLGLALRQDAGTAQSRLDRDAAIFRHGLTQRRAGCASAGWTCGPGSAGISGGSACVRRPATASRC